jgi:hypothetical protein
VPRSGGRRERPLLPAHGAPLNATDPYDWVVVPPVIVEACGMLVSRRKNRRAAMWLLAWMLTPGGRVILLPDPNHPMEAAQVLDAHAGWMRKYEVDFVDAYLMHAADRLTRACSLRPHAPVFTFDTGDYLKCSLQGYLFSLYDMRELDLIESLRVAFPAACGEHEEWTPEYPAACGGDRLYLAEIRHSGVTPWGWTGTSREIGPRLSGPRGVRRWPGTGPTASSSSGRSLRSI